MLASCPSEKIAANKWRTSRKNFCCKQQIYSSFSQPILKFSWHISLRRPCEVLMLRNLNYASAADKLNFSAILSHQLSFWNLYSVKRTHINFLYKFLVIKVTLRCSTPAMFSNKRLLCCLNRVSEFKILWDNFRSHIAELWFPYDCTIAIDRSRSQTVGSQAIAEVCFHMIADDRRTFCDLWSAICDRLPAILWKPASSNHMTYPGRPWFFPTHARQRTYQVHGSLGHVMFWSWTLRVHVEHFHGHLSSTQFCISRGLLIFLRTTERSIQILQIP